MNYCVFIDKLLELMGERIVQSWRFIGLLLLLLLLEFFTTEKKTVNCSRSVAVLLSTEKLLQSGMSVACRRASLEQLFVVEGTYLYGVQLIDSCCGSTAVSYTHLTLPTRKNV